MMLLDYFGVFGWISRKMVEISKSSQISGSYVAAWGPHTVAYVHATAWPRGRWTSHGYAEA